MNPEAVQTLMNLHTRAEYVNRQRLETVQHILRSAQLLVMEVKSNPIGLQDNIASLDVLLCEIEQAKLSAMRL